MRHIWRSIRTLLWQTPGGLSGWLGRTLYWRKQGPVAGEPPAGTPEP